MEFVRRKPRLDHRVGSVGGILHARASSHFLSLNSNWAIGIRQTTIPSPSWPACPCLLRFPTDSTSFAPQGTCINRSRYPLEAERLGPPSRLSFLLQHTLFDRGIVKTVLRLGADSSPSGHLVDGVSPCHERDRIALDRVFRFML